MKKFFDFLTEMTRDNQENIARNWKNDTYRITRWQDVMEKQLLTRGETFR